MLKGKTKIILTDVETGEQEIHEDENIVTNAIDKIINIEMAGNHQPNSYILPIATNILGGIMLFDNDLTEDPANIHFPSEAHLVGYGDQSAHTGDKFRGTYNAGESGKTDTGYVSVWDFGTNQANGTIKSVARTSNIAGACPFYDYLRNSADSANTGNPETDTYWNPIRYDGEYLYMLKGDTSTHQMRLARVKIPCLRMGVADYSGVERTYEVIASWDTFLTSYTYWGSLDHQGSSYEEYVYGDIPLYYEDGNDGYFYCFGYAPRRTAGYFEYSYDVTYFTIKYGDGSYEKSETVRLSTGTSFWSDRNSNNFWFGGRYSGHICKGVLYRINYSRKAITIIPLSNPASYQTIQIIEASSQDYIVCMDRMRGREGVIYFTIYHYTTSSYEYLKAILYPDGVYVIANVSYGGQDYPHTSGVNTYGECSTNDDDLTAWGSSVGTYTYRTWVANFLGTINNLSSAITKTAAQTMKIIYTMTDVNE